MTPTRPDSFRTCAKEKAGYAERVRKASAVAASAGKNDSIASSATVMSTAVPKVASVLKKRSSRSPERTTSGTKMPASPPWLSDGPGYALTSS